MPTITIPDETYERLFRHAAALKTTVDDVVDRLSREVKANGTSTTTASTNEWSQNFNAILQLAKSHEMKYPPGFEADISREAMYGEE